MASPPSIHSGLQPSLGRWQILFYGLGSMLGAGIYALIGRAAESMGNAIWLSFLAAMVAALLTGLLFWFSAIFRANLPPDLAGNRQFMVEGLEIDGIGAIG